MTTDGCSTVTVVTFLVYGGMGVVFLLLVVQLQVVAGWSPIASGIASLPTTLLMMIGSSRAGALGERMGPRLPMSVGPIVMALGIVLLLLVAMLSSKGAAGITGAGFITLAATLSVVPAVPVAGMALILGIDRFMSECRALTNFVGNAVATIVVARWEGELDQARLAAVLNGEVPMDEEGMPVHDLGHRNPVAAE